MPKGSPASHRAPVSAVPAADGRINVRRLARETGIPRSTLRGRLLREAAAQENAAPGGEIAALAAAVERLAAAQAEQGRLLARLMPSGPAARPEPPPAPDADPEADLDYDDVAWGVEVVRPQHVGRLPSRTPRKVLVVADTHWDPRIATQTLRAMLLISLHAAEYRPDDLVHLGDGPDFASLRRGASGNDAAIPRKLELTNARSNLEALCRFLPTKASRHYCMGNHDQRLVTFRGADPERDGSAAQTWAAALDEFGFTTSDFGEYHWIGGVGYVHVPLTVTGDPVGGEYPEATVARDSTRDTVFGHCHRYSMSRVQKFDGRTVTALCAGMSMPEFFVRECSQLGRGRSPSHGILEITDFDGRIQSHRFVPMRELEIRFGHEVDRILEGE